jgi:arylsulfatase A-like enzyme
LRTVATLERSRSGPLAQPLARPVDRRLPRVLLVAPLALLLAVGACQGDGHDIEQAGPELRPGDTLLDLWTGVSVNIGTLAMPREVHDALAAEAPRATAVEADEWRAVEGVGAQLAPELQARGLTLAHAPGRKDMGRAENVAEVWLDGRRLTRADTAGLDASVDGLWRLPTTGAFVAWTPGGVLLASPTGQAELLVVWQEGRGPRLPIERSHGLQRDAPFEVAGVHRRADLKTVTSSLTVTQRPLQVERLSLALAVPDLGWTVEQDRLVRRKGVGDGVTFRVELDVGEGAEILFEQHLRPGDGWVEAVVDLSSGTGRDAQLRLTTDPGPAGDARFDIGVWADLRLMGPAAPSSRPHLVLIDVDTLRADRLGCYGHERDTSPGLDRWIERTGAVVFEDCIAPSSWTLPSTLSLLSGLTPVQHGVEHPSRAFPANLSTVAELLRESGYETWGLTEGGYTDPAFGAADGFDTYVVHPEHHVDWNPALRWLDQRESSQPAFLFLQTFAVHAPYQHDPRFESPEAPYQGPLLGRNLETNRDHLDPATLSSEDTAYLSRMYDAGIRRFDDVLAGFLAELDRRLPGEQVMVVITSDHGEEFGEHGGLDHGHTLHDELLRVPLVVRFPGDVDVGAVRADAAVSTLDVAPTLLRGAGLPVPERLTGHPLDAPPAADREGRPLMAWLGTRYRSVQRGDYKLIEPGGNPLVAGETTRLFRVGDDPTEQVDVSADEPEAVAFLRNLIEQLDRRAPALGLSSEARPDEETLRTLEQLGYAGEG